MWERFKNTKQSTRVIILAGIVLVFVILIATGGANDSAETEEVSINTEVQERSEEHTSELQSRGHLVCRLLLEKKKKKKQRDHGDDTENERNVRIRRRDISANGQ